MALHTCCWFGDWSREDKAWREECNEEGGRLHSWFWDLPEFRTRLTHGFVGGTVVAFAPVYGYNTCL